MNRPWVFGLLTVAACSDAPDLSPVVTLEHATELAQRFVIVDGHIDVPYRLTDKMEDITVRTPGGDFDVPRARAGGLDAPFMSIYTPASFEKSGGAKTFAVRMTVRVTTEPTTFDVAVTTRRMCSLRAIIASP